MKNGEYKYYFLFVLLVAGISFVPFFLSYGGINSDAVAYFKLAKEFPQVTSNLFPIGYPLLLKLGYYFTYEFYFNSSIIFISFIFVNHLKNLIKFLSKLNLDRITNEKIFLFTEYFLQIKNKIYPSLYAIRFY